MKGTTSRTSSPADAAAFEDEIVALIRALGLHRPDRTPCGQPVSVAEAQALHELAREPSLSQNVLASRMHLEKSTISRIASALEKCGWLARTRDEDDSRVLRLRLTPLGSRVARNLARSRAEKFARVFHSLPRDRRTAVIESLALLSEALDAD